MLEIQLGLADAVSALCDTLHLIFFIQDAPSGVKIDTISCLHAFSLQVSKGNQNSLYTFSTEPSSIIGHNQIYFHASDLWKDSKI